MHRPSASLVAIVAMGCVLVGLGAFSVVSARQGIKDMQNLQRARNISDAYARAGEDLDHLDSLGNRFMLGRLHDDYVEFGRRLDQTVVDLQTLAAAGESDDKQLVSDLLANGVPQARLAYEFFGHLDRNEPSDGPLPDESSVGQIRSRFVAAAQLHNEAAATILAEHTTSQRWGSAMTLGVDLAAIGLVLALGITMRRNYRKETFRVAQERERERAVQAAVQQSEAKLQQAAELASLAYWEMKLPFAEIELSERMQEFFGLPGHAAIGEMFERIQVNDRTAVVAAFGRSIESGVPLRVECNVTSAGDIRRLLRIYAEVRRTPDGKAAAIFGAAQDITEPDRAQRRLIESRAQLKALFDATSDIIVVVDLHVRVLSFNLAAAEYARAFLNVELSDGLFLGDAFGATFGPDAAARAVRAFRGERVRIERELEDRSGNVRWFEVQYTPIRLDQGKPLGIAFMVRDITERRAVEAQLLHAQKMESVGRLAGGVAHDFNNLLTAIIGYCDLASVGLEPDSQAHEDIEEAVSAAKKAAALTRQLLVFARQQPADPQDLDVNVVIADLEKMLGRLIGEQVDMVCSLAPEPLISRIDRGQFEQVLVNLVVNARDAMDAGGRLTIETHAALLDDEYCSGHAEVAPGQYGLVAVTDNGSGIPPDVLPHVFDPFFTTKEQGKGTGLGLATCYGIVKQAGGHIAVYSEGGRGTTFKVYLPLLAVSDALPFGSALAATPDRGEGVILLVEDQEDVRTLAARVLGAQGYRVISAPDPRQAIALAEKTPKIDLILSDLVMPGMDGVALVDLLTAVLGPTPVLLMSGYAEESVLAHLATRDDITFVSKPITPAVLATKVAEVLAARRHHDKPAA